MKKILSDYDAVLITDSLTSSTNKRSHVENAFFAAIDLNLPIAIKVFNSNMDDEITKYLRENDVMPPIPKMSRKSGTMKTEGNFISFNPYYPSKPDAQLRREMRKIGCSGDVTTVCKATYQNAAEELVKLARKNRNH